MNYKSYGLSYQPKVLMTKIGLDGHDRGSRIIAAYLRDAGIEVIYTGPWQPIQSVVQIATEEDVDIIGISSLATDHRIVPDLMTALQNAYLDRVKVVIGGIIPREEMQLLLDSGVSRVFNPGASREEIVEAFFSLTVASRN